VTAPSGSDTVCAVRSLGIWTAIPLIAACRFGFDDRPAPDAPADTVIDTPPTVLSCDSQPAFRIEAPPKRVAATAWRGGYLVVNADDQGNVHGSSYMFSGNELVPELNSVLLATGMSAIGTLGTISVGDQTLLVVPGDSDTQVIRLDSALAPTPAELEDDWIGGTATVATNASGQTAFIGANYATREVDVWLVGGDPTTRKPIVIAEDAVQASLPTIMPAGDDFLVVWDEVANHRVTRAELLTVVNGALQIKVGARTLNSDLAIDAENPRGAYLASAPKYLTAWMRKVSGGEIWASLRNTDLGGDGANLLLGNAGNFPAVAAGKDDFLVAWRAADVLYASRVSPAGAVTTLNVTTGGGAILGWDVVSRGGQPALVWVEAAGTGALVKFDPLCHR